MIAWTSEPTYSERPDRDSYRRARGSTFGFRLPARADGKALKPPHHPNEKATSLINPQRQGAL